MEVSVHVTITTTVLAKSRFASEIMAWKFIYTIFNLKNFGKFQKYFVQPVGPL